MRRPVAAMLSLVIIGAASNRAQSPSTPPTFQTSTRLVQVEVIVRGRDGQPVSGLTANDFALYDNGTQQPIALFSVQSNRATAIANRVSSPGPQDRVFSNGVGDVNGGATVILFDRLNTMAQDQKFARDELLKIAQAITPGDRVAIYVLGFGSVRILHDFTTDPAALRAALSRLVPRRDAPLAASAGRPADAAKPETLSYEALSLALGSIPAAGQTKTGITPTGGAESIAISSAENRADTTAHALAAIATRLAGLQGRKSMVWVSSGFPLDVGGQTVGSNALRQAEQALTDANVAIYPVDARGLTAPSVDADVASPPVNPRTGPANGLPTDPKIFRDSFAPDPIGSMQKLALDTGGRAFFNTNDLANAVEHALEDGRLTYVLGYYPSHAQWDGRFRDIKVTVDRPGVEVRYRKGYLAYSPPTIAPELRQGELLKLADSTLEATGLGLTARVDKPSGRNDADVTLAIQVAPGAISLAKTADGWSGLLDLLIVQTAADGQMFRSVGGAIDFTMPDGRRERFLREGLTLNRSVVLRPDARLLTLLVRDVASGALGSIVFDADALRHAAAKPTVAVRPDLTAYAALVGTYRSGRPESAVNQLATWSTRAVVDSEKGAALTFSPADRMAAAILGAETATVMVQQANIMPLVENALALVQAAGPEPFGHARGDEPRRDWYYAVAATLISAGRLRDASWVIRNGLVAFPGDPMLYFVRGTLAERAFFRGSTEWMSVERPAKVAVDEYLHALDVDPHLAIANVHLARVRMRMNDWSRARRPLESAVADAKTDPVRYLAHLLLGRLEEHDEHLDRAKAEYEAAFATGAGYQTSCIALSRINEALGHPDDARSIADQCPALSGHDDPWWSFAVQFDSDALTQLRAEARLP